MGPLLRTRRTEIAAIPGAKLGQNESKATVLSHANVYRLIRWSPVGRGTKFRWQRRYQNWHWARDMKIAEATRDPEHIERGHDEWQYEFAMLADEEQAYYSRKLLERARALRVEVPAYYGTDQKPSEDYEESFLTHKYQLSLKGEAKVRAAIREEEKHRSEIRARFLPFLAALTGLVGAITGLVAAFSKLG